LIVSPNDAKNIKDYLNKIDEEFFIVGEIINNKKNISGIIFNKD
jgi:hypothetical protein